MKQLNFKIIRHKQKKMLSYKEPKNFKETNALIEGHFILQIAQSKIYSMCPITK